MRYVKDNKIYSISEIRKMYPDISLPSDADCSFLGFSYLIEVVAPIQEGYHAKEVDPINNVQTWELIKLPIPKTVTMRQARIALYNSGLLDMIEDAIIASADEILKIEWEYATEINRDWQNLINLTTSLGITSEQLDTLFFEASKL